MQRAYRYLALIAAMLFITACSVTRSLPEGEYLLSRVEIKADEQTPRSERITPNRDNLEMYVRQSPNKRIFGLDFYVWVYEHADSTKNNWWNNFKRKIGEEPVILNEELTEKSIQNLQTFLHTKGYFASRVTCEVDTTRRRRRAELTYTLTQGEPTRIESLRYEFRDSSLRPVILADTAHSELTCGSVLDITLLDAERNRISRDLNNKGYFDFTVNNISYEVDTIGHPYRADVTMIVQPVLKGYNERGASLWEDNAIYRIKNINVYPTYDPMLRSTSGFKAEAKIDTTYYYGLNIIRDINTTPQLRNAVLRRTIDIYPNYIYNAEQIAHTTNELMSLGFFRSTKVNFRRLPSSNNYVTFMQADTSNEEPLVNTREEYLDCDIYCTPALKQSLKIEVEASSTATFYGLGVTAGYSNSNVFRGAEAFDIAARFGFEYMYARDVAKRSAQEVGITAGISFPRFLLPFNTPPRPDIAQPRTRLELAFDYQDRPYYRRNIFSTRWAYSWNYLSRSSFVVRPIDVNWIDVKSVDKKFLDDINNRYLRTSFESQLNAGLSASYVYNTQRSDLELNPTIVRLNVETSGNLIQGIEHLFSQPAPGKSYYEILGVRYSQYVRAEVNASQRIDLGSDVALAGRIFAGIGATYGNSRGRSIPFDRMFYCGGANSMRGWVPRTLGPGNHPQIMDTTYPAQVGDVRLEANLELRFPIWWIFHGAAFLDAGNIWYLRNTEGSNPDEVFDINTFYKQLGFNTGLGLRIDATFVILRIDLGIQLHNPGWAEGERWIHNFKWKNMALNFGIGYPF